MLGCITPILVFALVAISDFHVSAAVRSPPLSLSIPGGLGDFKYLGCFTDEAGARSLTAFYTTSGTIEECFAFCGYADGSWGKLAFIGLEYGHECYCDWVIQSTALQVSDNECNMPCVGNASQPCGGPNRLTIFTLDGGSPTTAPTIIEWSTRRWAYQGCYRDSRNARVLPHQISNIEQHGLSLGYCADACAYLGFIYAGIEYRTECWCGNIPPSNTYIKGLDSECGMACFYAPYQRCGGPDRLSLYKLI